MGGRGGSAARPEARQDVRCLHLSSKSPRDGVCSLCLLSPKYWHHDQLRPSILDSLHSQAVALHSVIHNFGHLLRFPILRFSLNVPAPSRKKPAKTCML